MECSVRIGALWAPRQCFNDNTLGSDDTTITMVAETVLQRSLSIRLSSMMAALQRSGRRAPTSICSARRSRNQSSLHSVPSPSIGPLFELSVNMALTEGTRYGRTFRPPALTTRRAVGAEVG